VTEIPFYLVAAFSDQPFAGNPAVVCLLKEWLPDELLLNMARQHNQSETAFVLSEGEGFALRWFTTRNEVNLCGHATLASARDISSPGLSGCGHSLRDRFRSAECAP
jgi:PhzF family phenazine biosynthesis protein